MEYHCLDHGTGVDHMMCSADLIQCNTQQTQDVESILVKRWSTVYDAGPTLNQHCFNVLCLLGSPYSVKNNSIYLYYISQRPIEFVKGS